MDENEELEFFPAYAFPVPAIADHHPVFLTLHGIDEKQRKGTNALKVGNLSAEYWAQYHDQLQILRLSNQSQFDTAIQTGNTTRALDINDIREVLQDRKGRLSARIKRKSPFEEYCARHMDHPDKEKHLFTRRRKMT